MGKHLILAPAAAPGHLTTLYHHAAPVLAALLFALAVILAVTALRSRNLH